jgi:hypothetical protein
MKKGHCQMCGQEYLLVDDDLVLVHEVHVPGWLEGYCAGSNAAPMEKRHGITDFAVADMLQNCERLRGKIDDLRNALIHPATVALPDTEAKGRTRHLRWEDLSEQQQDDAVRLEIVRLEKQVAGGEKFARDIKARAASVHGLPLMDADRSEQAQTA